MMKSPKVYFASIKEFLFFEDDDLQGLANRKISYISIVLVLISYSILAIHSLAINSIDSFLLNLLMVLSSALAILLQKKFKSTFIPASSVLFVGLISAYFRTHRFGGIESPVIFIWILVPILLTLFSSAFTVLIWTFLFTMMPTYFFIIWHHGEILHSTLGNHEQLEIKYVTFLVVQFTTVAVLLTYKKIQQNLRNQLKKEKEDKSQMLRVIGHDIANPLTAINLCVERLKKTQQGNVEVERIAKALVTMKEIIEHVKLSEAVASGKKALDMKEINLLSALEDSIFLNQELINQKKIKINIEQDSKLKSKNIIAESMSLTHQVLSNLITNAIKFSFENGSIDFQINQIDEKLELKIIDHGVGIPSDILSRIFDPTKQTSRIGTSGEKGTGFGMPIVKTYVEKFGGTIRIHSKTKEESSDDHGTVISIRFPVV